MWFGRAVGIGGVVLGVACADPVVPEAPGDEACFGLPIFIDFEDYRGTADTLPGRLSVQGESADGGPFTGVHDLHSAPPGTFDGFGAFTAGDGHAFGIRERGASDLRNARLLLRYENTHDDPVIGFDVSYDVGTWLWGERANRIRLKFDLQPAEGFEDDLVSTDSPRGPASPGDAGRRLDGTLPANRVSVSTRFTFDEVTRDGAPLGLGPLERGEVGYLRWQFSNTTGDAGDLRSALSIDEILVRPLVPCEPLEPEPDLSFSRPPGVHEAPFELEITGPPGVDVYYTLDGSTPDRDRKMSDADWEEAPRESRARTFRYTGPIDLGEAVAPGNDLSEIPTNELEGYRGWEPPHGPVPRVAVVRAKTAADVAPYFEATKTFLIGEAGASELPVVSVATDRQGLFDEEVGIYVQGTEPTQPNYSQRGPEWERPGHLEVFEPEEGRVLAHGIGIRIHGDLSRRFPQKTLRVYARNAYGPRTLEHRFFHTKDQEVYRRLLLRNAGNDWGYAHIRDATLQGLVHHFPMESQHSRPAVLYLNGEYWGIHRFRDRLDRHHLEAHHGIPADEIAILGGWDSGVHTGTEEDREHYLAFLGALQAGDLDSLAAVDAHMEVTSFIDYTITQWYAGNRDWPQKNSRWWRYTGSEPTLDPGPRDGRWCWLLFDVDVSFAFGNSHVAFDPADWLLVETGGRPPSRFLYWSLFDLEDFREAFLQRLAVHLETTFHPDRVVPHIEANYDRIGAEMPIHAHRWTKPLSEAHWWNSQNTLVSFAEARPGLLREILVDFFDDLTGTADLVVSGLSPAGDVHLHTVPLVEDTPGVWIDGGTWAGEVFAGIPVVLTSAEGGLSDALLLGDGVTVLDEGPEELRLLLAPGAAAEVVLAGP